MIEFDKDIFADKVIKARRTTYKDHPDNNEAIGLAFTDVANEYGILGKHRGELKSEIGSILGKRKRRKKSATKAKAGITPPISFKILEQLPHSVEFVSESHRITFHYSKDALGNPCMRSSIGTTHASESLLAAANVYAAECFKQAPRILLPEGYALAEMNPFYLSLIFQEIYWIICSRSDYGNIIVRVTKSGRQCPQSALPTKTLQTVRAIARQYFSSYDSHSLPGI